MNTLRFLPAAAVLVALVLTGCSTSSPAPAETAQGPVSGVPMSQQQKAALADDKVTYDEYEAGFRRYVACDAKAGYKVIKQGEENEVIQAAVPSGAVKSGADDKCFAREWEGLSVKWQALRENTSPQAQAARDCLTKHGLTPAKTYVAMYQQLRKAGLDPNTCQQLAQ